MLKYSKVKVAQYLVMSTCVNHMSGYIGYIIKILQNCLLLGHD
jgi:hypothetical protein